MVAEKNIAVISSSLWFMQTSLSPELKYKETILLFHKPI